MLRLLIALSLITSFSAEAHYGRDNDRRDDSRHGDRRDGDRDDDHRGSFRRGNHREDRGTKEGVRECVRDYSPRDNDRDDDRGDRRKKRNNSPPPVVLPTVALNCGDTVTSSMMLANDLNCPDIEGFALKIIGDNIVFNGNGHKIDAPNAAASLYVQGDSVTVTKVVSKGNEEGYGILAYNSEDVKITQNDFSENYIGIMIYSDGKAVTKTQVLSNIVRDSVLIGVRTSYDEPGSIDNPKIAGNDLSRSGSYALRVEALNYELTGVEFNIMNGSANGVYLAGGHMNLHDFTLANQGILENGIFIDSALSVRVDNVNVSSTAPADQNQKRIGLDLYRCKTFQITRLTASNNDVGLKFETEGGVSSTGTVQSCKFTNNVVSGIMVVSYDATPYGVMKFLCNSFYGILTRVFIGSSTVLGAGSII